MYLLLQHDCRICTCVITDNFKIIRLLVLCGIPVAVMVSFYLLGLLARFCLNKAFKDLEEDKSDNY